MTVKIERSVIVTTKEGARLQLEPTEKIETETRATVTCNSFKCASRHNAEAPVSFTFVEEKVKESVDNYPEVGDYFISVVIPPRSPSFKSEPLAFCGAGCLKDWLQYTYISPGPREIVQKTDKADGTPSAEDLDIAAHSAIPGVTATVEEQ